MYRLIFVVVFGEARDPRSPGFLTTAPRILAVLVNDAHKFYYICMLKLIILRFGNYYFV